MAENTDNPLNEAKKILENIEEKSGAVTKSLFRKQKTSLESPLPEKNSNALEVEKLLTTEPILASKKLTAKLDAAPAITITKSATLTSEVQTGLNEAATAASKGDVAKLEELHKKGIDLSVSNDDTNYTPAMRAAYYGQTDVLEYLDRIGVDVNAPNADDLTASDIANIGVTVTEVTEEEEKEEEQKSDFDWQKACNGYESLSFLKKGSKQSTATTYLQENLQAVGALGEIPDNHFGHYGNKTTAAVKTLQEAFKEIGTDIKVDGSVYVQSWAALAALKETGTKLTEDGKIPEEDKELVLEAYKNNLPNAGKLVLGKIEPTKAFAATDVQNTRDNTNHQLG